MCSLSFVARLALAFSLVSEFSVKLGNLAGPGFVWRDLEGHLHCNMDWNTQSVWPGCCLPSKVRVHWITRINCGLFDHVRMGTAALRDFPSRLRARVKLLVSPILKLTATRSHSDITTPPPMSHKQRSSINLSTFVLLFIYAEKVTSAVSLLITIWEICFSVFFFSFLYEIYRIHAENGLNYDFTIEFPFLKNINPSVLMSTQCSVYV